MGETEEEREKNKAGNEKDEWEKKGRGGKQEGEVKCRFRLSQRGR